MVGASRGKCIQNAEIRDMQMKKLIVTENPHKKGTLDALAGELTQGAKQVYELGKNF